ncbi:hypothetical protein [uncultured Pseudomonas sp.]|uniref:hypothetical protein n=1 Tax=uncultured Pseudomonas sp. TaxID=114707 RepID=UPI0026150D5C|nr:hypothetical protein [uncultured Pseudomonas sp.]
MTDYIKLLLLPELQLSSAAQFFLLRFVQQFGLGRAVTLGVKELAKALGMTDRVISLASKELAAGGYLNLRLLAGGKGRPSTEYECLDIPTAKRKRGTGVGARPVIHAQRIDKLLRASTDKSADGLSWSNRLLLAVLLVHADEFGVVRGLGLRDLSDLTGLRKDVLANRLQLLIDKCFIRARVPGATGSGLFRPMKSAYYLNLPLLSSPLAHADAVLIHCSWWKTYQNEMSEAERIFGFAAVLKEGLIPGDSYDLEQFPYLRHVEPLVGKLNDSRTSRFIPTLQSRLDDYAAILLSSHWSEIQGQAEKHDHGLFRRIYRECRVVRNLTDRAGKPLRKELLLLLMGAARHRAKSIQHDLIANFSELPLESLSYLVMPSSKQRLKEAGLKEGQIPIVTTLLVAARQPWAISGCHVAVRDQCGQPSVEHLGNESALSLDLSRRYGLQSLAGEALQAKDAGAA